MQSKIIPTIALFLIFSNVFSQKGALKSITENELQAHVEFIASDYMQGRDFGTEIPGLEITIEYLKNECRKMELLPGGKNYSQIFKMISVQSEKDSTSVRLINKNGEIVYESKEITTFPGSVKNDTIEGKIIFAGYGFENKETSYNDFEGLDLKDKVVIIMTRNREIAADSAATDDITNLEMTKFARIFMAGARGVLFIPDPLNPDRKWFEMLTDYASQGYWQLEGAQNDELPENNIIIANNEIVNKIIAESGYTIEQIQTKINATGKPNSFELENVIAEFILTNKITRVKGENIIGIVEGSDPVLKNECIVITAHYDHVGMTGSGEINNGADDNASGTSALLEIAEAFSIMKKKPRRSIVFAWVSAEEKGLIGSEYYTLNPYFPLKNTVANINLDMVGRSAPQEQSTYISPENSLAGPNGIHIITGHQSTELWEINYNICKKLDLVPDDDLSEDFLNGSDQYHFYKKGIPVVGITTGLHEDYHFPTDDAEKIDYTKMKRIASLAFLLAEEIANRKNRIVLDNPLKQNQSQF